MGTSIAIDEQSNYSNSYQPGVQMHAGLQERMDVLRTGIERLEQRATSIFPTILTMSAALSGLSVDEDQEGLVVTGTNFVGGATKSTGTTGAGAGGINWTAVLPGKQTWTLSIASDGGLSSHVVVIAVDADEKTIAITYGPSTTAAEVIAAVAANKGDDGAAYIVSGVAIASGAVDADECEITGGTGLLPVLTLGETALDGSSAGNGITAYTDTSITFDVASTDLTDGMVYRLGLLAEHGACANEVYVTAGTPGAASLGTDHLKVVKVTGTGNQTVAHGLGVVPSIVFVSLKNGHNGSGGSGTQAGSYTFGTHTTTDIVVNATSGVAWEALVFAA